MYQSQRQRFRPSDTRQASKGRPARSPRGDLLLLPAVLVAALSGCATDGKVTDPLASLGNPFQRPTEAGFRALARANCGQMSVGESTVGTLLGNDNPFDGLITDLYAGDISNDEFMNRVLLQYPAADANIPATGCIEDQLVQCFAETCAVQTAAEREKMARANADEVAEIDTTVTIDPSETPAGNAKEVDQMIEASKDDGPKPLP